MRRASISPFILSPVAQAAQHLLICAALGLATGARAQMAEPPVISMPPGDVPAPPAATTAPAATAPKAAGAGLKITPKLAELPPRDQPSEGPTFVFGDRVQGRPNLETIVEGNAEIRRGNSAIRADRIEYYQPDDLFKGRGNVRINKAGNRFEGPELEIELERFEGFFTQPSYRFLANGGNGQAERVDFIDSTHLTARGATYTTCERGNEASWKPAWVLTASRVDFDFERDVGVANDAVLRFKEVPILGFPKFSFPLSDKRKSGLLPPTIGLGSSSGIEYRQPYYFDIAPNRDATFTPGLLSKRGVDLAGEFRYLEPTYRGVLRANYLPNDRIADRNRWSYGWLHNATLNTESIGPLGLALNLNRVSDNDYWRDLPASGQFVSQRLFQQDATLSWSRGYFSTQARALKWQTLQDINAPIVPPYDRLPQLTANYSRIDSPVAGMGAGFDWSLEADYTRFQADSSRTLQPNSDRTVTRAKIARPYLLPAGFITPRLQLHATSYQFDAPLADGSRSASRVLPTFSLDTGVQFERSTRLFNRDLTQTLEPRAFYVRTPFRDQSRLPNYDSGENSFNFASIFSENAFVGDDRISDANLLTLGVSNRLLDPATGAEAARFEVAQRLRFDDQRVRLPGGLPISDRISDLLVGTSINWAPEWRLDGTVQYNPKTKQSDRSSFGVRYNPTPFRTVSAALRRQRGISQNVDVGWQWPINDLWGDKGQELGAGRGQGGGRYYAVGRLNYSVLEKKFVDSIVGVEYDGCCWIGRVVLQRSQNNLLATGASSGAANTQILFQLELIGFSRLGSSPLQALRSNVPRYQLLRDKIEPPSRFTTYD